MFSHFFSAWSIDTLLAEKSNDKVLNVFVQKLKKPLMASENFKTHIKMILTSSLYHVTVETVCIQIGITRQKDQMP